MGLTRPRFNQLQESDFKSSCRVATTSNVTLLGGTPATVDGVNLQVNDRVLVTGQTDATENGIYFVSTLGSGSNGSWTRALDANENAEVSSGLILTVTEGTLHSSSIWKLTTSDPITIGGTELTFVPNLENSNVYVKALDISDSLATIDSFSASGVTTVRWLISATDNVGGYHKTSTVDAVTDGTTITEIEYGVLLSDSAQDVVTIGTTISGGNIVLQGTGTSANVSVRVNRITLGSDTTTGYIRAQVLASAASAVDLSAVDQDIIPATDVTYDLGSSSYRWRDLYLSGSTIDLGGAKITTNNDTGAIAFVPPVTVSNPNPSALVVSPTGTISVAVTSAGVVETANIQASAPSLPPKISSVEVTDSGGTVLDDTAVDTAGGYIKITGSNFVSGCSVLIGTTPATSTTFVSSTVLTVQVPAAAAGSYILYVVNPDGATAIKINGVTYSVAPTWVTSSSLPDAQSGQAYSQSLSATNAISYSLDGGSSLPSGMTLTSVGLLSGTSTVVNSTNYSFTVLATDAENQDSPRTFSLNVSTEPELGSFYNGGYYAGRIAIDGYIYRIILSPKSSGQSYRQLSNYSSAYLMLNQSGRSVIPAQTKYDGWHVTNTMASTGHYLGASWARSLIINGYNDWYLPSLWEMWLCYVTFKPTTANNYAGNASPWNGYNPYTRVPGWPANTTVSSQNPSRTSITEFQNSGAQAFVYGGSSNSTLYFTTNKIIETGSQYVVSFDSGDNQAGRGFENNGYWSVGQTEYINLRVIRRELVGPE